MSIDEDYRHNYRTIYALRTGKIRIFRPAFGCRCVCRRAEIPEKSFVETGRVATIGPVDIRHAQSADAAAICDLVNFYAEQDMMLHRSLESVYENLREFIVAADGDVLLGCVAVDIYWGDQAEIRSLAVSEEARGRGVGGALIGACIEDARRLGIEKLFAMTYVKPFFEQFGFTEVDIMSLPEKVWRECLDWYARGHRHETAMLLEIRPETAGTKE